MQARRDRLDLLAEGIEALCHVSEIEDRRPRGDRESPQRGSVAKPGVQLDASQLLGLLGLGPNKSGYPARSGNALTQGLAGAAAALGVPGGMPGGATALAAGPFAGVLQGQAQGFLETLKRSVRELRVTVSWKDGKDERSVSASQEIVILPESVGRAGQVQQVQPLDPVPAAQPGRPARPYGGRISADGDAQE